ncbi:MAG: aminotransferase class I/II-fold pyridoxal phosphate-dependent enzyme [Phycisphaerales bacterium]|nr:aminotransferase class I/II-fold pyridoxal phosphate-dependent enzyme [Phycisphaerales bacterium]
MISARLQPFGQTIFTEISLLALKHGAVNLGQGFPNFDGPEFVKNAAIDAIRAGHGQYARMFGVPELNRAIAARFTDDTGLEIDPDAWVTVTSGCTEAIAAALIGLVNPGDEVVLVEPWYDSYRACVAMADATPRYLQLEPPDFRLTRRALEEVFNERTRAILLNTPHNPTGRVFDDEELSLVAELATRHDAIVLADEVYERLVFEGRHRSIATLPGMAERTVTLSSLGKTFSLTGWKIGWAIAPPALTAGVRAAHQFLTFATATPLQHAATVAMQAPRTYDEEFLAFYRPKRDLLVEGLERIGFVVHPPQGTYFVVADHTPFGFADDRDFCRHLVEKVGVAAIPVSAFYHRPGDGSTLVRFAFCKTEDTLREGLRRLEALRA